MYPLLYAINVLWLIIFGCKRDVEYHRGGKKSKEMIRIAEMNSCSHFGYKRAISIIYNCNVRMRKKESWSTRSINPTQSSRNNSWQLKKNKLDISSSVIIVNHWSVGYDIEKEVMMRAIWGFSSSNIHTRVIREYCDDPIW